MVSVDEKGEYARPVIQRDGIGKKTWILAGHYIDEPLGSCQQARAVIQVLSLRENVRSRSVSR
jgi:hypothetical protein